MAQGVRLPALGFGSDHASSQAPETELRVGPFAEPEIGLRFSFFLFPHPPPPVLRERSLSL